MALDHGASCAVCGKQSSISQFSVIGTAPGRKAEKTGLLLGLLGQQTLTPRSGS